MRPLTLDDLMPLEEYAGRRPEFFESQRRYLDRYRRVRVGPLLTLIFQNRQTLWFRLQELVRIARLMEPGRVQRELDCFNRLLPQKLQLQAALMIEIEEESRLVEELMPWRDLRGDEVVFHIGDREHPAELVTARPEDRAFGAAHWLQFTLDPASSQRLGDFRQSAYFEVNHGDYRHQSLPLSEDVRQSLLEDLELSEKDGG
jgi:Protein of unknown function (DUF3501)